MSVLLDARPYVVAGKAAIKAQIGVNEVYEYGKVPGADGNKGSLPDMFVLVSLERRSNPNLRLSAQASTAGWRLSARGLGRTVPECQWLMWRISVALNEQFLTVGGRLTTPLQFDPGSPPTFDSGKYVADDFYTFAH